MPCFLGCSKIIPTLQTSQNEPDNDGDQQLLQNESKSSHDETPAMSPVRMSCKTELSGEACRLVDPSQWFPLRSSLQPSTIGWKMDPKIVSMNMLKIGIQRLYVAINQPRKHRKVEFAVLIIDFFTVRHQMAKSRVADGWFIVRRQVLSTAFIVRWWWAKGTSFLTLKVSALGSRPIAIGSKSTNGVQITERTFLKHAYGVLKTNELIVILNSRFTKESSTG